MKQIPQVNPLILSLLKCNSIKPSADLTQFTFNASTSELEDKLTNVVDCLNAGNTDGLYSLVYEEVPNFGVRWDIVRATAGDVVMSFHKCLLFLDVRHLDCWCEYQSNALHLLKAITSRASWGDSQIYASRAVLDAVENSKEVLSQAIDWLKNPEWTSWETHQVIKRQLGYALRNAENLFTSLPDYQPYQNTEV